MKMLMPSHAKNVKQYKPKDGVPLYFRYQVETQIDEIYSINVRLKSGGYIVINPTEALISIDVNSGKATKGRHIEETALRTNVEAAEEVARQLRLRDLGGLVVIDFIDMEENKNNRTVERHLKDAMQRDRARIQFGRISAFGLLELSRQRLRPSLVETNFEVCEHCHGIGVVRTVETSAAVALRAIEEEGLRGRANEIKVTLNPKVALYIFNNKRDMLASMESKYKMHILLDADDSLIKPDYNIEVVDDRKHHKPLMDLSEPEFTSDEVSIASESDDDDNNRKGRRRRRRGGRRRNNRGQKDNGDNQNQNNGSSNENGKDSKDSAENNKNNSNDKSSNQKDGEEKKSSRARKSSRGKKVSETTKSSDQAKGSDNKNTSNKEEKSDNKADKSQPVKSDTSKPKTKKPARKASSAKSAEKKTDEASKEAKSTDEKKAEPKKAAAKSSSKKSTATKGDDNTDVVSISSHKKKDDKPESHDSASTGGNNSGKKGWWQRLTD